MISAGKWWSRSSAEWSSWFASSPSDEVMELVDAGGRAKEALLLLLLFFFLLLPLPLLRHVQVLEHQPVGPRTAYPRPAHATSSTRRRRTPD